MGQAQYAFIDGGERHPRLLTKTQPLDRNLNGQGLLARDLGGGSDGDIQASPRRFEWHIDKTERAPRFRTGDWIARLDDRC